MSPADLTPARRGPARLRGLATRRPGPAGTALLVPTWVALGVALVVYVVGMLALAFAAVLVATLRLLLTPPLAALARPFRRASSAGT